MALEVIGAGFSRTCWSSRRRMVGGRSARFLEVPAPECRFPRVNSRDELTQKSDEHQGLPADPEVGMRVAREYIDQLKARAFVS